MSTQITQTASNISLLGTNIDALRGTAVQLGLDIDAANENIRLYADKVDNLEGITTNLEIGLDTANEAINLQAARITDNETSISRLSVTVDGISSAVTSLEGDLALANSRIDAVAAAAEAAAYAEAYSQLSNPWKDWPSGTESRHLGATWKYTGNVNTTFIYLVGKSGQHYAVEDHLYRYVGVDGTNLWEDITDISDTATYVSQNKDMISAVVGSFDGSGNLTNTSGLVTTAYATEMYATRTMYDSQNAVIGTLDSRIAVAESGLSLLSSKFNSSGELINKSGLVSTSDFTSLFSEAVGSDPTIAAKAEMRTSVQWDPDSGMITSEIKLSADMLTLEGYTTINEGFSVDEAGNVHGKNATFNNVEILNEEGSSSAMMASKTIQTMINQLTQGKGINGVITMRSANEVIDLDLLSAEDYMFMFKAQTMHLSSPPGMITVNTLDSSTKTATLTLGIHIYITVYNARGNVAFTRTIYQKSRNLGTYTSTGQKELTSNVITDILNFRSDVLWLAKNYTAELHVESSLTFTKGTGSIGLTLSLSPLEMEWWRAYTAWTLVGIDGIHISNMDKYIKLINSGENVQIQIQGLSTSAPSTPGMLWNDNGTVKIST